MPADAEGFKIVGILGPEGRRSNVTINIQTSIRRGALRRSRSEAQE
jgi:hypothetical protein